ncbi:MAG TPA: universal stress protein [Burkholderiaceae bacterium]
MNENHSEQAGRTTWILGDDGTSATLQAGAFLAGLWEDAVLPPTIHLVRAIDGSGDVDVQNEISPARQCLDAHGVAHQDHVVRMKAADAILSIAHQHAASDIAVGGQGGAGSLFALGSVAYQVMHRSIIPLTVVREAAIDADFKDGPANLQRICLAMDGSACALRALEHVTASAKHRKSPLEIHLVNVQPPVISGLVKSFISNDLILSYQLEQGAKALSGAKAFLDAAGLGYVTHVSVGTPAEAITAYALRQRCGRIVMGARGMSIFGDIVLGSVSYKILHGATVPVTIVK